MRKIADIERTMTNYADTVLRVCMIYLPDKADCDDAFQDTFIKYAQAETDFNDDEHCKAWLIRVATNTCKDMLKQASRRNTPLDLADERVLVSSEHDNEIDRYEKAEQLVSALQKLDEKYRTPLYLKYYEDYTAAQIAAMLDIPENTVYTNLARGREQLKEVLNNA